MLPVTCMCYPSALVVNCFCYHRCNPWGVTRVTMPPSNPTLSLLCNYEAKRHSPTCFGMQPNHGGCLLCCYTGYLGIFSSFLV